MFIYHYNDYCYSYLQEGPLKIAIPGGTDTPLGGQVIISHILEGGAAERYGGEGMEH